MEEIFKALSDPTRLAIVRMLAGGEMCVCKIMEAFDMSQPAVSHHLASLKRAGLVRGRKEGQWVHYSLRREALAGSAAFFDELLAEPECGKICCGGEG
ncbi:MAG: ArsR/SmtB family transcription factor [Armatimonadota bacterium]